MSHQRQATRRIDISVDRVLLEPTGPSGPEATRRALETEIADRLASTTLGPREARAVAVEAADAALRAATGAPGRPGTQEQHHG
jgi:hypothetical protein